MPAADRAAAAGTRPRFRGVAPGGVTVARSRIERPMIQSAFRVHPG